MAQLIQLPKYDIKDSNIALLGSDVSVGTSYNHLIPEDEKLEKRVRGNAGDIEPAWKSAGTVPGLELWRIEKFKVVACPVEHIGTFYDGDSYICLHVGSYNSSVIC